MIHKIYGPPGTGKTTQLIEYLMAAAQTVPMSRIAFLTFSRKARNVALARIQMEAPYINTIHALCYSAIGAERHQVLTAEDIRTFGGEHGLKLSGASVWDEGPHDNRLLHLYNVGRARLLSIEETVQQMEVQRWLPPYMRWAWKTYQEYKFATGRMDFTDMLLQYCEQDTPLPVDIVFLDEAQDLSPLQWKVFDIMARNAKDIYMAGDDDQGIFHWAGASGELFAARETTTEEVLHQSYRLPQAIHAVADKIVKRITSRVLKTFRPTPTPGCVQILGHFSHAPLDGQTLILHRNQYLMQDTYKHLERIGQPYAGKIYSPEQRSAISDWEKWARGEKLSVQRLLAIFRFAPTQTIPRKIRSELRLMSLDKVIRHSDLPDCPLHPWNTTLLKLEGIPVLERSMQRFGEKMLGPPKIEVSTIHQAKGGEADRVIIIPDMSKRTRDAFRTHPDAEHRVWYVAVTRARKELFIVRGKFGHYHI